MTDYFEMDLAITGRWSADKKWGWIRARFRGVWDDFLKAIAQAWKLARKAGGG